MWKAGIIAELADLVRWDPPSWLRQAACRNPKYRPSWWFMDHSTVLSKRLKRRATLICENECPVRWRCLARYLNEPYGVFGGLDKDARDKLKLSIIPRLRTDPVYLQVKVTRRNIREVGKSEGEVLVS